MNNGLKKAIALVSALGIVMSAVPVVMADDINAENGLMDADAADISFVLAEDEIVVGSCDFNDLNMDGGRFLQSTTVTYYEVNEYVQLENGARKDGANGNTGFYQTNTDSATYGTNVTANIGQYVTADRGQKINFTVDESVTAGQRVITRFEYKPTNGTGNTADLIIRDTGTSTDVATLVVGVDLVENSWNSVEIATETDGRTNIIVNGSVCKTVSMTPSKYPQLRFSEVASEKDLQSYGCIDNIVLSIGGQLTDEDFLNMILSALAIDTTQTGIDQGADEESFIVSNNFSLPATPDNVSLEWKSAQRAKGSDDEWTDTEVLTIDNGKVTLNYTEDIEDYEYRIEALMTYNGISNSKYYYMSVKTPSEVINEVKEVTELVDKATGETLKPNEDGVYEVNADLALDTGAQVKISWSCKDAEGNSSSLITADGIIMPTDDTSVHTLVATFSFNGVEDTKSFQVVLPNAVTTYVDPVINELKLKSADDATVEYEASNIGTVKNDIELPTSVSVADGKVAINWTSNSESAVIVDSTTANSKILQVYMEDFGEKNISLTAEFTYVKNNVNLVSKTPDSYDFKVQFTKEDMEAENALMDKYKVRFDSNYEDNFADIPTIVSSDITLPTKGYFGSTISWTSSAPTVISAKGVFVKPSSTRTVTLTASIMSGKEQATKSINVTAQGKTTSSGGSSGGSTSSTGTTSSTSGGSSIANSTVRPVTDSSLTSGSEKVDALIQEKEEAENRFSDIGGVSWARDAINGLADAGVINGKTDTEFAPNDNVTRAEFAKILMGVFGLTSDAFTTSSFNDVSTSDWYFNYVETAYNLGIINGVEDGVFAPNANITRQDMCVMVVRAAEVSGKSITAVNEAKVFADEASIADYAKSAVTSLQTGGIVDGVSDTMFAPLDNATRAQAAKILYSFL